MSKRPSIGVGVIIRDGDQVLLMKRQNSHGAGTWSMPGGHLEYGETPQECAIREAEEEVGVCIADPSFCTITNDFLRRKENIM
ncbi:MAG: NUDIX domain-containing protein [Ktedonobacteraceae bacterium]